MAHFAELDDNNVVKRIVVIHNNELLDENGQESEQKGIDFCLELFQGGIWKQTSFNKTFRKNYPTPGETYDPIRDAFIPFKPFDSWILNEDTCRWQAPIPKPEIEPGINYIWNENEGRWDQIQVPV